MKWRFVQVGAWLGVPLVKSLNQLKILVLEDEAMIGMLIEDMLSECGCGSVDVLDSVDAALDYLDTLTPDFVMLDINVSGGLSYPVADRLLARDVPFVFLSGYGVGGLEQSYRGCRILKKPFHANDIEAALRDAVHLKAGSRHHHAALAQGG